MTEPAMTPTPATPRRVRRPAKKPATMTPLVVRVPSTLLRQLKKDARASGVTLSYYIRDVLASAPEVKP